MKPPRKGIDGAFKMAELTAQNRMTLKSDPNVVVNLWST